MDRQFSGLSEEVGIKKAPKPDNFIQEINKSIILNKEDSVIAAIPQKNYNYIYYVFI